MTANKRIFLNVAATYGRSLYALAIGLISGRWILLSLGEVDYGLMGLVGGMIGFVAFVNNLLAGAVGRYYAFTVGKARNDASGIERCRQWFNTALSIHAALPTLLVIIGYPLGVWAIHNFLTIPADRIESCVWVWRFSCASCFVAMSSVPFSAMYTAKQDIAELTIYDVASTTLNFLFISYMITHPGVWLVRYAAWASLLSILPKLIICARACVKYQECRINVGYLWSKDRVVELLSFAAGCFICALSLMISNNGRAILVNKFLGPAKNAAMAVGTSLSAHVTTLASAMSGAFYPAITNACGEGDMNLMRSLCIRVCKFSAISTLIFSIPLFLEAETVLVLWLKAPPKGAAIMCALMLADYSLSRMTEGHWMGVFAVGKMAWFNAMESLGYFFAFAAIWALMALGLDIASVGLGMIAGTIYTTIVKLYYAKKHCQMDVVYWVRRVLLPVALMSALAGAAGFAVCSMMPASFVRVILTTCACEAVLLPLTWYALLDAAEKEYLVARMKRVASKFGRG